MLHQYVCSGHWHNYFLQPRQGVLGQCLVYLFDVYGLGCQ